MKLLTFVQAYKSYRPSFLAALCWCIATSVLTTGIGFSLGGWSTPAAVAYRVEVATRSAKVDLAVEACVDNFLKGPNVGDTLRDLADRKTFRRPLMIETGGWAVVAGDKPIPGVAALCARALVKDAGQRNSKHRLSDVAAEPMYKEAAS